MRQTLEHIDKLGKQLSIGDEVVFIAPGYRMLVVGRIVTFNKQMVTIEYVNNWNYCDGNTETLRQKPDQVIKIKESTT